ncbi:MAG: hypothetical protein BGO14_03780 [Chlamydiales bacterium 38-26]|nr:hypothetical protein [Chlamydiales bacterium]OJV09452.1 MAG: hypothetical protein BGO14_03780 [Chlamydiales bacterium 38-26]
MRKLALHSFFCLITLLPLPLKANLPGQPPSSSSSSKLPSNPFHSAPPTQAQPLPSPKRPLPPVSSKDSGPPFTLPGIVALKGGQWEGSDNLYNLSPNVGIYIEIVKPEGKKIEIDEAALKSHIQEIFSRGGINPNAMHAPGLPGFPLFHVLILVDTVEQFVVASCSCRIFESVGLQRVIIEPGITYQAITWEKQELLITAKDNFEPLLLKSLEELSGAFVSRFQYFQNVRLQQQSNR